MSAGQNNVSHSNAGQRETAFYGDPLATVRTPARRLRVPPAAVTEMGNTLKVRPATLLAAPTSALKPDHA